MLLCSRGTTTCVKHFQTNYDQSIKLGGKEYDLVDGVAYRVIDDGTAKIRQLLVPKELQKDVLFSIHDDRKAGYLGVIKTYDKARRRFYWPKMFRSVKRYVNRCLDCWTKNPAPGRTAGYGQMMEIPTVPFHTSGCDLAKFSKSSDNKLYVIVCTDHCTRYAITGALKDITAATVAKFIINNVVLIHGSPDRMLTVSSFMELVLETISTKHPHFFIPSSDKFNCCEL